MFAIGYWRKEVFAQSPAPNLEGKDVSLDSSYCVFYLSQPDIRICYARSQTEIEIGVKAIADAINTLK